LSVTIPSITPSQNTPVLPNMRRIVIRPEVTEVKPKMWGSRPDDHRRVWRN
jgi:hypothetical protein